MMGITTEDYTAVDILYGSVKITEPAIIELIQSKSMQRLKGVLQYGISAFLGKTAKITRFEHSIGAMLLVRRLGKLRM
jgi:HD superfamily phosphohydrolase